jgi:hypothetical protein
VEAEHDGQRGTGLSCADPHRSVGPYRVDEVGEMGHNRARGAPSSRPAPPVNAARRRPHTTVARGIATEPKATSACALAPVRLPARSPIHLSIFAE